MPPWDINSGGWDTPPRAFAFAGAVLAVIAAAVAGVWWLLS